MLDLAITRHQTNYHLVFSKVYSLGLNKTDGKWTRTGNFDGAGSSPAGSVGRDCNLQKLHYQYLTTSVAVLLVVC